MAEKTSGPSLDSLIGVTDFSDPKPPHFPLERARRNSQPRCRAVLSVELSRRAVQSAVSGDMTGAAAGYAAEQAQRATALWGL